MRLFRLTSCLPRLPLVLTALAFCCGVSLFAQQHKLPLRLLYNIDTVGSELTDYRLTCRLYNDSRQPVFFRSHPSDPLDGVEYDRHVFQPLQGGRSGDSAALRFVPPQSYLQWTAYLRCTAMVPVHSVEIRFAIQPLTESGTPLHPGPVTLKGNYYVDRMFDYLRRGGKVRPAYFELAFEGMNHDDLPLNDHFVTTAPDTIRISSGRIALADERSLGSPFVLPLKFPVGAFPAELSIGVDDEDSTYQTPCYLRIRFSNEPVTRWAYALAPGVALWRDTLSRPPDQVLPVSNDNTWLFAGDADALARARRDTARLFRTEPRMLRPASGAYYAPAAARPYAVINAPLSGSAALVGFDRRGRICRLLLDLGNYQFMREYY